MLRSGVVSGGLLVAVCYVVSHTDFWNCSRNSCAWPFCVRSTLDCIVWRAASTGAKAWVPLAAMVGCDLVDGLYRSSRGVVCSERIVGEGVSGCLKE